MIPAYDLKSIYEAPLAYHDVGLDQAVLDAFQIAPAPKPNLARWLDVKDRLDHAEGEVKVAIVGKYTQLEDAYKSIAEALTPRRPGQPGEGQGRMDRRRDLRQERRRPLP